MAKYQRCDDAIAGPVIIDFLDAHTREEGSNHTHLINGRPIGDTPARAIYRWKHEGVQPRLDAVERILHVFGLTFREFEEWADATTNCIWFYGEAPEFWTDASESLWREDLQSTDPLWIREAREYGIAIGEIKPRKTKKRKPRRRSRQRLPRKTRRSQLPVAA